MFKSAAAVTALTLALGGAACLLCTGCDDQGKADRDAAQQVDSVELQRAKSRTYDDLTKIQNQYDAVPTAGASEPMQIALLVRQSQLRFQRASILMGQLRAMEMAIGRTIDDINQLGLQVAAAQASIKTLKTYDPSSQIDDLKKREADIRGGPNQPTWTVPAPTASDPNAKITLPTLAQLDSQIQSSNDAISKNRASAAALHKQSSDAQDQAENLTRQAEGEAGAKESADVTKAAQLRRDAAVDDAQVDTLNQQYKRLQADLDDQQTQKTALEANVTALDKQIETLQKSWTDTQAQIDAQQQLEQKIIAGDTSDNGIKRVTIAQRASELQDLLNKSDALRKTVDQELAKCVAAYSKAAADSEQLRKSLIEKTRSNPADPDLPVWQQMMETLHPAYLNMLLGSAVEAQASVAAGKVGVDLQISRMLDGYTLQPAEAKDKMALLDITPPDDAIVVPGLRTILDHDQTGIDMPAALANITSVDQSALKTEAGEVDKLFQEALKDYATKPATDTGAIVKQHTNAALIRSALANRDWAQFSLLMGDTAAADEHTQAADQDQAQVDPEYRAVFGDASATTAPSASNE